MTLPLNIIYHLQFALDFIRPIRSSYTVNTNLMLDNLSTILMIKLKYFLCLKVCCPTSVNEDNIRFDNNKKIITATMRSTTLSSTSNETPTTTDKPTHAIRQRVTAEVITRVQEDSITTTSTESVIIVNENDHNKNKIDERPLPVKPLHEAKKEISRVSLLPSRNVCGQLSSISERIVGGDHTDPNEFPWTVRLKYPVRIGK